jgi:putative two-component system response regulator
MGSVDNRKFILIIDDTPTNIAVISGLLKDEFRLKAATSGIKALTLIHSGELPDLVLLDIMMPEMDGYEVCRRLKENSTTSDIPVIFLTAKTEVIDETTGLEMGAVDYIHKPFNPAIVKARVRNHLLIKDAKDFLKVKNKLLENLVAERTRDLANIQDVTILALSSLVETRDKETGNHIRRIQFYIKALATKLQNHPRFYDELTPEYIELLYKSAPLHDIGKVGILDKILLKPGRLTPEEFETMKLHATIGHDAIANAEARLGLEVPFLRIAKAIAYGHHEKWDGTGYPQGLKGDAIPVSARLMAIADVYDALISRRVYKGAMTHEQAVAIIREGRGIHFDPDITDSFLAIADEFHAIAQHYADRESKE